MIYSRICPQCKKEIKYKHKGTWKRLEKKGSFCFNCTRKNLCKTDEQKKQMASHFGEPRRGRDNPFYGKKHSDKTKAILAKKCRRVGKECGMYGRSFYDIWLEKYGKKEANKKMVEFKKKQSILHSGKNNPMYGKPSPQGSGNGWSGWYKGWYFRSLRELSYVINYLEKNNLEWISAEKKKFSIPYKDYDGTERTYRPDFFVENSILVEIKPNRLKKAVTNNLKKAAAEKFCKKNNYKYEVVEPKRMKDKQIADLYKKKKIKFLDRYEKKFKERYLNE